MNTIVRFLSLLILPIILQFDCIPHQSSIGPVMVPNNPPTEEVAIIPRVILVTIDGVRWQDVFNGTDPILYKGKTIPARELLPNLYGSFADHGMVVGRDSTFVATGPAHISLPGYLEIMRGHPSTDCQTNECEPKLEETMADLFETSAVFASWDTIRKTVSKNPDRFVINCGRNYRSQAWKNLGFKDDVTFPEFFDPWYRPDDLTKKAVLEYLEHNTPQFLWVSLGDTDEWAHAGNYQKYLESLVDADKFVGQMISWANAQPCAKDFTFIVTADHGRSLHWQDHGWDAESARDWVMIYGRSTPAEGFVHYNRTKSLSNILPTVKSLVSGKRERGSLIRNAPR
jgi:hypothetical protein